MHFRFTQRSCGLTLKPYVHILTAFGRGPWLSTHINTLKINKNCVICHWICQIISFFLFFWGGGGGKFHGQDDDVQHSIQSDRRCSLLFCFVRLGLLCSVSWYHPCMVSTVDWMLKIK